MAVEDKKRQLIRRFTKIREELLRESPFYGSLVMNLKFGLAPCQTAYTDMRYIVFDPKFMERLSDEELKFVVEHEVLHCVLLHCIRGGSLNHRVYNIACDIVVNSNILHGMDVDNFQIDGENVMHLAPDGKEGYLYTAEQVYDMLYDQRNSIDAIFGGLDSLDNHDVWDGIKNGPVLEDEWKKQLKNAGGYHLANIPPSAREMLLDLQKPSRISWRELLHDFIQIHNDNFDYTFLPPDRRFSSFDIFLPSFCEMPEEYIENIWFCVDTSGSISNESLNVVYSEIGHALQQVGQLKGMLSFFDTHVTKPIPFDSLEELQNIEAVGGGGTSFHAVFQYLREEIEEKPKAIIMLTDGYADIPDEEETEGVPVLWVLTQPEVLIPWGVSVYITT